MKMNLSKLADACTGDSIGWELGAQSTEFWGQDAPGTGIFRHFFANNTKTSLTMV